MGSVGMWDTPRGLKVDKPAPSSSTCATIGFQCQHYQNAGYYMGKPIKTKTTGPKVAAAEFSRRDARKDSKESDVSAPQDIRFPSTVETTTENNSGEDVPVFALGPQSHMFSGVHEQAYINHAMQYAS